MNQEQIKASKENEETWVTTGQGVIYVNTTNLEGRTVSTSVGGRAGAILRITQYDRLRTQENTVEPKNDPFTNGMLIRADADQQQDETTASVDALNNAAIGEIFGLGKGEFRERVDQLGEYNVRRMIELIPDVDATQSQIDCLRETLAAKWPLGGPMPIYKELSDLGQVATLDR